MLEEQFRGWMDRYWPYGSCRPAPLLTVALSGGSDSMALLMLCWRFCSERSIPWMALMIDHGLREESSIEVAKLAEWLSERGIRYATRRWQDPSDRLLQCRAREARYRLLAEMMHTYGALHCLVGHQLDDVATGLILRLERGAGLVGLSSMPPRELRHGVAWLRPLLDISKEDLRGYLREQGVGWLEDPSNRAPRFARTHASAVLASWESGSPLGGAGVRQGLRRASEALRQDRDDAMEHVHRQAVHGYDFHPWGWIERHAPADAMAALMDVGNGGWDLWMPWLQRLLRLVGGLEASALRWEHRHRLAEMLRRGEHGGGPTTVGRCQIKWRTGGGWRLFREYRHLPEWCRWKAGDSLGASIRWDGKWLWSVPRLARSGEWWLGPWEREDREWLSRYDPVWADRLAHLPLRALETLPVLRSVTDANGPEGRVVLPITGALRWRSLG
jgi:tRNA(Ile)-lysidine synthase